MKREVNLLKMALIVPIITIAVLSFFPCVSEYTSGSVDDFQGRYYAGVVFGNAKWLVLSLSFIEIPTLFSNKKISKQLYKYTSLLMFLITLLWPLYLMITAPNVDGTSYGYSRTILGYVVLALTFIQSFGYFVYEMIKKRISRSV